MQCKEMVITKGKTMRYFFCCFYGFSTLSNASVYCQATTSMDVFLKGEQSTQSGNKGDTTIFPLSNLSSRTFPYRVDKYYESPIGYESHAASTPLLPGSEPGWRKINDFLEVKLSYRGGMKTVPYGWTYADHQVKCNYWPIGSSQNFADIINKTEVTLRLTKTLVGNSLIIPRTILYRQHWGVVDSLSATNVVDESKYLYQLTLTEATLSFPAVCRVNTVNLDVNFGSMGPNEINTKERIKSIDFICDRDAQLTLQVGSSRKPYGNNEGNKTVSFGSSLENLNVDAEFSGMTNKGNGILTPPISVKKGSVVSIPVTFRLNQQGAVAIGAFSASGYIVLYQD
ncbi:hypothetical protein ACS106_003616 [Escherichia coli]